MTNYKTLLATFTVLLAFAMVGCQKGPQNTLKIGLQSGYPPFEFMDSKGKITGFDIDVAYLIADKLSKNLVIKDMEFEGVILSLKQGKIDLIMSGMDITPSRLQEIHMVPYHGEGLTHLSLIFWGEIPEGVQCLEDIAKLSLPCVSVESGASPQAYLARFPLIQTKALQGALNPLMDVKYGKSSANLVEPDVATYLKGQHPEIQILDVPLPQDAHTMGFGIGIKKENLELYNQVSKIIQELKETGQLKVLEEKWFKNGGGT